MSYPTLLIVTIAAPALAACLSLLGPRRLADVWGYPAAAISLGGTLMLAAHVLNGGQAQVTLLPLLEGAGLEFRLDALGVTFAVLASGLWLLAAPYSSGYARAAELENRPRFFACFSAAVGCAIAIAFAGNLITFLLFYELLTLSTYPLVVHKQTPEAMAGGRRYLLFTLSGGMILTAAVAWTWFATGTLEFVPGGFLAGTLSPASTSILFAMFMAGCGVKAAVMPLHSWLPAAMVAPTPVSALLHAVAVVKAGVFGCLRVVGFVFGPQAIDGSLVLHLLAGLCAATIVIGSLLALRQDHLKRRLAYSTIVHLSYIVLGAALMSPYAMTGSILHMVNHGLAKITLFFCAGAIYVTTHHEYISQLKGLGRRMPWTFAAFTVASLGLIGMPGLCGFVSKLFLVRGAMQADQWYYLLLLLMASLFSAMYLLPIIRTAYFDTPDPTPDSADPHHHHSSQTGEARTSIVIPLVITAVLVIAFGMFPLILNVQYELASRVATAVFGGVP